MKTHTKKLLGGLFLILLAAILWSKSYKSKNENARVGNSNPSVNLNEIETEHQKALCNSDSDGIYKINAKKIKVIRVDDVKFKERVRSQRSNENFNNSNNYYLKRESVFYDLFTKDMIKVARLPNTINVEVGTNDAILDHGERDIEWEWYDDFRIFGIQYIYRIGKIPPPKSNIENEFPLLSPNLIRVYLLDVRNHEVYYELELPKVEEYETVKIEGISVEGYLSLSAVSPDAYSRPESKNDSALYRYLGIYKLASE